MIGSVPAGAVAESHADAVESSDSDVAGDAATAASAFLNKGV